jgi:hypothetical protein
MDARHLTYRSDGTDASTGACDVLIRHSGVCRDYAIWRSLCAERCASRRVSPALE